MDARLRLLRRIATTNNTVEDWARYAHALEQSHHGVSEPIEIPVHVFWAYSTDWDNSQVIGLATTEAELRQMVLEYFDDLVVEWLHDGDDINDPQIHHTILNNHNEVNYITALNIDVLPLTI
jgi:hypothetical protein